MPILKIIMSIICKHRARNRFNNNKTIYIHICINHNNINSWFLCSQKMSAYKVLLAITVLIAAVKAQRPFYAGLSPIGYPAVEADLISNRFGEDDDFPIDARGDRNLINRLDALPVNNQPFWYLNWRQYDALRRNPQVYPQRPNNFIGSR